MNSVNPVKAANTLAACATMAATMLKQNNLGFFKDLDEVVKKYTIDNIQESFVIGDVFRPQDPNCVEQYHGVEFSEWLYKPSKKKVIQTSFGVSGIAGYFVEEKITLKELLLQNEHSFSVWMGKYEFWRTLYALIIKPEIGRAVLQYELLKSKSYLFHVELGMNKDVIVIVDWRIDHWLYHAVNSDELIDLKERDVLVYAY